MSGGQILDVLDVDSLQVVLERHREDLVRRVEALLADQREFVRSLLLPVGLPVADASIELLEGEVSEQRTHEKGSALQPDLEPENTAELMEGEVPEHCSYEKESADSKPGKRSAARPEVRRATSFDYVYEQAQIASFQHSNSMGSIESDLTGENKNFSKLRKRLHSCIKSGWFELFVAIIILSNAVVMGIEVEVATGNLGEGLGIVLDSMNVVFTVVFTIELMLRWLAEGWSFFYSSRWNYIDLIVVVASVSDQLQTMLHHESSSLGSSTSMRLFRFARITRLIRVLRIGRIVRFIHALSNLVDSILATIVHLLWSLILFLLVTYAFALFFADASINYLARHPGPWAPASQEALLDKYFGGLGTSVNTLFRAVTDGISWAEAADSLAIVDSVYLHVFNLYVFITVFAIFSVITAVFCQNAMEQAEKDQYNRIQHVVKERKFIEEGLTQLFEKVDEDGSGRITVHELEKHFEDGKLRAFLETLGLEAVNAWSLFTALDMDGDCTLSAPEFLEGCMLFKGQATSLEMVHLRRDLDKVKSKLAEILTVARHSACAALDLQRNFRSCAVDQGSQSVAVNAISAAGDFETFDKGSQSVSENAISVAGFNETCEKVLCGDAAIQQSFQRVAAKPHENYFL